MSLVTEIATASVGLCIDGKVANGVVTEERLQLVESGGDVLDRVAEEFVTGWKVDGYFGKMAFGKHEKCQIANKVTGQLRILTAQYNVQIFVDAA